MKLAFICHRWHGDKKYEKQTKEICLYISRNDKAVVPVSTALLFNSYLDDADPHEREVGISSGLRILEKCDILYLYKKDGISNGMKKEIQFASCGGIPIEVMD